MGYYLGAAADTGCYRIKTKRRRIRDQKEHRDKQLLKTNRKLDELELQRRNLPMVELNPPVQRGWVRYFVLRDDVARSADAALYESILSKVNSWQLCYRKDFKRRNLKKGRKQHGFEQHKIQKLDARAFRDAKFTDKEKRCFEERWEMNSSREWKQVYVFKEKWRFVPVIRPNMITKVKALDPEIVSGITKLDRSLDQNQTRPRLCKLLYGWYPGRTFHTDKRGQYLYANKPLHAILGMIAEDACTDNKMNYEPDQSVDADI